MNNQLPTESTMDKSVPIYFFVGSTNPVKVASVKQALLGTYPMAEVKGIEVKSGVSAQPMSDAETKLGATNRAQAALQAGVAELMARDPATDSFGGRFVAIGVGLEGGVFESQPTSKSSTSERSEMWSTVWVVVADQENRIFATNGARFLVPEVVAARIRQGEEMGVAAAQLSGIDNVKQKGGLIGILTHDFTDRTTEYTAIAKLSLGMWYGRPWQK